MLLSLTRPRAAAGASAPVTWQMGIGLIAFVDDYEHYPVASTAAVVPRGFGPQIRQFRRRTIEKHGFLECPPPRIRPTGRSSSGQRTGRGRLSQGRSPTAPRRQQFHELRLQCMGRMAGMVPNQGWAFTKATQLGRNQTHQVKVPSEMIALGDSNWDLKRKDRNWSGFIGMYEERQWPPPLHNERAEILFVDGHVSAENGSILLPNSTRIRGERTSQPSAGTSTTPAPQPAFNPLGQATKKGALRLPKLMCPCVRQLIPDALQQRLGQLDP